MNKIRCIITICLAAMTMAASAQTATSNHNFEVAKNLDIFNALYRDLDLYYVDTLDAAKNIDNAANYMLEMLDPYTEYYAEDNSADLRQLTTGKYVGIGALTTFRPDLKRCIVAQPFAGMPADQVGILPGDIIMAIDGKQLDPCTSADKKTQTDYANSVTNQLRGEPGTTFELKVRRPTTGRTYTYKITRRNITRPSVTLAAMVADSVGYIRLSQFIDGTSNEIRRALVDLKQRGARRLVLDLRNNPRRGARGGCQDRQPVHSPRPRGGDHTQQGEGAQPHLQDHPRRTRYRPAHHSAHQRGFGLGSRNYERRLAGLRPRPHHGPPHLWQGPCAAKP